MCSTFFNASYGQRDLMGRNLGRRTDWGCSCYSITCSWIHMLNHTYPTSSGPSLTRATHCSSYRFGCFVYCPDNEEGNICAAYIGSICAEADFSEAATATNTDQDFLKILPKNQKGVSIKIYDVKPHAYRTYHDLQRCCILYPAADSPSSTFYFCSLFCGKRLA